MVTLIILICALSSPCSDDTAQDRMVVKNVPIAACGLAGQMVIAAQPGERAEGRLVKIICKGGRKNAGQ